MQRDFWSLILACGFGAFVGAFVSLEIAEYFQYGRYFWGFGVIIGGLFGYVSVDFSDFREGLVLAYKRTVAWRPNWAILGTSFLFFITLSVVLSNAAIFIGYLNNWEAVLKILALSESISLLFVLLCVAEGCDMPSHRDMNKVILYGNPISVVFLWLPKGLWWSMKRAPSAVVAASLCLVGAGQETVEFATTAFRYVHSRRRTICFGCAALGAAVGYQAGSAVIGASVGATLGAVEYQLVAIHWLKVVPNGGRA